MKKLPCKARTESRWFISFLIASIFGLGLTPQLGYSQKTLSWEETRSLLEEKFLFTTSKRGLKEDQRDSLSNEIITKSPFIFEGKVISEETFIKEQDNIPKNKRLVKFLVTHVFKNASPTSDTIWLLFPKKSEICGVRDKNIPLIKGNEGIVFCQKTIPSFPLKRNINPEQFFSLLTDDIFSILAPLDNYETQSIWHGLYGKVFGTNGEMLKYLNNSPGILKKKLKRQ
ncbi:MAG: hypothetical protein H6559_04835 [Lewinellaceae bacterium]|nr:hypothetical protein [Lewinellaceae bacterium]